MLSEKEKQSIINAVRENFPEKLTPYQAKEVRKLITMAVEQKERQHKKQDLEKPDYKDIIKRM